MTLPPYSRTGDAIAADCATKAHLSWRAVGTSGLAFEWCGSTDHAVRVFRGSGPALMMFHLAWGAYNPTTLSDVLQVFQHDCQAWLSDNMNRIPKR